MNAGVILLLALEIVIATGASLMRVVTEDGTLTLEGRQRRGLHAYIQGYFTSDDEDEGIRFKTASNHLVVTTLDHEALVKMSKIPLTVQAYGEKDYAVLFQIMDTVLAESNDRTYHIVNPDVANTPIVQGRGRYSHSNLLASLQAVELKDPQRAIQSSMEKLIAHSATRFLEPAARALGKDMGMIGRDEPAVMPFYAIAMKVSEAFDQINTRAFRKESIATFQEYPNCDPTTCPPCQSDECMGLCGKKCSCWKYVCGDCCLHKGCEMHDVCCRKHGMFSTKCISVFGMSCDSYMYKC